MGNATLLHKCAHTVHEWSVIFHSNCKICSLHSAVGFETQKTVKKQHWSLSVKEFNHFNKNGRKSWLRIHFQAKKLLIRNEIGLLCCHCEFRTKMKMKMNIFFTLMTTIKCKRRLILNNPFHKSQMQKFANINT